MTLPPHLHPLVRRALSGSLPKHLQKGPGQMYADLNEDVVHSAARHAIGSRGMEAYLERVAERVREAESFPGETEVAT